MRTSRRIRAALIALIVGSTSVVFGGESMSGVAAVIRLQDEVLVIAGVLPDGPAETAGLLAGDEILTIDGTPVAGTSLVEAAELLRGAPFSTVELRVRRDGGMVPVIYQVMRQTFAVPEIHPTN